MGENSYRLRLNRASYAGFLISLAGGRLRRLQAFDRPAFGNDPPLRLPGGDEENLRRVGFRETIGQSAVLHPNSMFRFDFFFACWNLSYPPNQSSI